MKATVSKDGALSFERTKAGLLSNIAHIKRIHFAAIGVPYLVYKNVYRQA